MCHDVSIHRQTQHGRLTVDAAVAQDRRKRLKIANEGEEGEERGLLDGGAEGGEVLFVGG